MADAFTRLEQRFQVGLYFVSCVSPPHWTKGKLKSLQSDRLATDDKPSMCWTIVSDVMLNIPNWSFCQTSLHYRPIDE